MWDPELDGVDHLNVYSKARTELGQWLSNFAYQPIHVLEDGTFNSVEGYWYWLTRQHVQLRTLCGWEAKKLGRSLPEVRTLSDEAFQLKIRAAIMAKAYVCPDMIAQLRATTLPLAHYYVFNTGVVRDAGYKWILDIWDDIRAGRLVS